MAIYVNYEGLQQAAADVNTVKGKFNEEYVISERTQVEINDIFGWITNFKLFDLYSFFSGTSPSRIITFFLNSGTFLSTS